MQNAANNLNDALALVCGDTLTDEELMTASRRLSGLVSTLWKAAQENGVDLDDV
jgi:hypothetical protein